MTGTEAFWIAIGLAEITMGFLWDHRFGVACVIALFLLWAVAESIGSVAQVLWKLHELLEERAIDFHRLA